MRYLQNIPQILYINLDHRDDRRNYMESQFEEYKIKNYKRISASKYLINKENEWENLILDEDISLCSTDVSLTINHIETISKWYDDNTSDICIIMEDDLNMDLVPFWTFEWEDLMKNLPYNWECVQLYMSHDFEIPMYLRPRVYDSYSTACYMINRNYARKLVQYHYKNKKFKLNLPNGDVKKHLSIHGSADYLIYEVGKTYSFPIFTVESNLNSDNQINNYKTNPVDVISSKLIFNWWKYKSEKYTLEDIFTYGKCKDLEMTLKVDLIKKNLKYTYE